MTRLLFLVAAVALLGTISVPLILSRRYSDGDRYKGELADWHVRWGSAASQEERKGLVEELGRIEPPLGSASGLNRHRQYVRAHELVVLSDGAANVLIEHVRASVPRASGEGSSSFGCDNLAVFSNDPGAERALEESSGVRMDWVRQACDVRAAAQTQLSAVRAEALLDWLKDEIRAREP